MYLDCDCADVVDEGCKQEEDDAEEAGITQAGYVGLGVLVEGVGSIKVEEEVEVVASPQQHKHVEGLLWQDLAEVEESLELLDGDVPPYTRLCNGGGVAQQVPPRSPS